MNKPVIYQIRNLVNDKYYIGSTAISLASRKAKHLYRLRRGTHNNPHLQNAFNKYGEDSFVFEVLQELDSEITADAITDVEQFYLNIYVGNINCYNINKEANTVSPEIGRKGGLKNLESGHWNKIRIRTKESLQETGRRSGLIASKRGQIQALAKANHKKWKEEKIRNGTYTEKAARAKLTPEERYNKRKEQGKIGGKLNGGIAWKRAWTEKREQMLEAAKESRDRISKKRAEFKPCCLISPTGEKYLVINRTSFCKMFNLACESITKMLSPDEKWKSHKQVKKWTGHFLTQEETKQWKGKVWNYDHWEDW